MCIMISPMMQLQAQGVAKDDVVAIWINEQTKDTLEIYKVGDKFFAKIVELKQPIDPETGKPYLDKNNPDPEQAKLPLKGLTFVNDCVFDGNVWKDGSIYDYESTGKTRKCIMKFPDVNNLERLRVTTVLPLFNKTSYWTKKK